ncbi:MAG: nuclear transport factor 2 family protein [Bacteroidota bacterium]
MKKVLILAVLFISVQSTYAQSEFELISQTLTDYIEGSTNGDPKRLATAFHPDLNLYAIGKENKMTIWPGTDYIADTKEGKPTGEDGKIISIDYENNAAVAKVEISHPKSPSTYVDYFMLLKIEGKWTIIHKMYTKRTSNKVQK